MSVAALPDSAVSIFVLPHPFSATDAKASGFRVERLGRFHRTALRDQASMFLIGNHLAHAAGKLFFAAYPVFVDVVSAKRLAILTQCGNLKEDSIVRVRLAATAKRALLNKHHDLRDAVAVE